MSLNGSTLDIVNARVVLQNTVLENGSVRIRDERIAEVHDSTTIPGESAQHVIDAQGALLMPGVIDLHNDNLEHEINPRADVGFPIEFALRNMETRLASSGVTTEFHAISFQDNPRKARTIANARDKAQYVAAVDSSAAGRVRHHILHRIDMRVEDSIELAMPTLVSEEVAFASMNDHAPGQGQYRDIERLVEIAHQQALAKNTTPTDASWYYERMQRAMQDTETIPAFYRRIGELMEQHRFVLASHDDDTPEKVDEQLQLGASVAEFPVTFEAAEHARAHGMMIVVGAPNIVRGGSQSGNLAATDLVSRDLADVICADYHAPSMLPAAWKLMQMGLRSLPEAIAMLTSNAASAVGLMDRGLIEVGRLADLIIVRETESGWPVVEHTLVGGATIYTSNVRVAAPVAVS